MSSNENVNATSQVCLNIGCGNSPAEGWLNIDSSPHLRASKVPIVGSMVLRQAKNKDGIRRAVYGDIVHGLKLQSGSCELVFASHVLEHLTVTDFDKALDNIYAYLRPGGILRVIVPDLRYYIERYRSDCEDEALASEAALRFMTLSGVAGVGSRNTLSARMREALSNRRHQMMWDEASLTAALARHGFKEIHTCRYRDWGDGRFATVEAEALHERSICLEATK